MKVILYLVCFILVILSIPFRLIDYIFISIPKELIANKYRKNVKKGDRYYFDNILGGKTEGKIEKIYKNGEVLFVTPNSSQSINIKCLYPILNK